MENRKSLPHDVAAAVAVGALCAALLWVAQIRELEQEFGLRWLFQLRGPAEAPQDVVLVIMNQRAADHIFLPRDPEKYQRCIDVRIGSGTPDHDHLPPMPARWPRCLHALLIEQLNRAGASAIVFDVLFRQRAPQGGAQGDVNEQQDAMLASAMLAARNVVIAQKFDQYGTDGNIAGDQPVTLSPAIEHAALGVGPFQLPVSANRRIDRYDLFKTEGWITPGLPMLALQAHAINFYPQFRALLAQESADAAALLPASIDEFKIGRLQATVLLLRQIFLNDAALAGRMHRALAGGVASSDPHARLIDALVSAYTGDALRFLNFSGPAGRIPGIGYDQVLALPDALPASKRHNLKGKVVFVGYAEDAQMEQVEHFATVYSGTDVIDLSGVEIAATAFVNLLEQSSIRPAPSWSSALIVFTVGLAATLLCLLLGLRHGIPLAAALAAGYLGMAVHLFGTTYLWLPIVMPLLVSTPAGIACATARKYVEAIQQRNELREAFRKFVPPEVADELARNSFRIAALRKSVECACVATDAAQFSTLAEDMASDALTDLLNEYFESLFTPVIDHKGFISDVAGDAMLALWPEQGKHTRQAVCNALLEMRDAADAFNRRSTGNRMATRFGANWGKVTLGTVGARMHFEYRAVGDPVNVSARIQELNKKLGTRILVSHALAAGVEGFAMRDLGLFKLRGRKTPERIFELIQTIDRATPAELDLVSEFAGALQILHAGDRAAALAAFQDIQTRHPSDGVAAFYVDYLLTRKPIVRNAVAVD